MTRRFVIAIACSALSCGSLTGCSDPRFKAAQTRRDQRVRTFLAERWAFHKAGPERAQRFVEFLARNEARHEGKVAADFKAIADRCGADARRLHDEGSPFGNWYTSHLPGHPERIPDTVARMIY